VIYLVPLRDADFDWFLHSSLPSRNGLRRPPGGVEEPPVLGIVRTMSRRLWQAGCDGAWMVVAIDEVVGLCRYKPPPAGGQVEIGGGTTALRSANQVTKSAAGRGLA